MEFGPAMTVREHIGAEEQLPERPDAFHVLR